MEDVQVVAMLVRRCVAGDAAAWEEIVQTYNRRIYNICYRFADRATMPKISRRKSSSRCTGRWRAMTTRRGLS